MSQKIKTAMWAAALVLLLAVATIAYNALRSNISPEIILAETQGNISPANPQNPSEENSESTETQPIKAPDFSVEDRDGNIVMLSQLEGKPVVLNFWASWCPPCKGEMPEFDQVYKDLGEEISFMMVNLTDGNRETKEKADEYVLGEGFSFPVYYDVNQDAAYAYGIRSIPTTLFIDSDGYIVNGAEGQIDEEILRYGISLIQ